MYTGPELAPGAHFFFQDSFHKDQKGQKIAERKHFLIELFGLIICHSDLFLETMNFLDDFFKLLISCCANKITSPLYHDANLAKLGPVLRKL